MERWTFPNEKIRGVKKRVWKRAGGGHGPRKTKEPKRRRIEV